MTSATPEPIQLPFDDLLPDAILDAVEAVGYACDGRLLALNSFENRVYQVGVHDAAPVIVKFYRPGRWSDEQIQEEHAFAAELADLEIPLVAPLEDPDGVTLHLHGGHRFAVFPRMGGHAPELDDLDTLLRIGRLLGRLHRVGASASFRYRPRLDIESFGRMSVEFNLAHGVPAELRHSYETLCADLLPALDVAWAEAGDVRFIRTHGDCHVGNMLARTDAFYLVDLDDARSAPAIQDLWMLLSGDRARRTAQLAEIIEGYEEFAEFAPAELRLVEVLRALRLLHHSAWLARRWSDPAFPRAFPWFGGMRYWEEQILALREQYAAIQEEPLTVGWN